MNKIIYSDLKNKSVAITGTGRGIGEAIARAFIKQGSNVILISKEKIDWLNEVSNEKILIIERDIQDIDFFKQWINDYSTSGKKIDILVNNAGIIDNKTLMQTTPKQWDKVVNINSKATFFLSQLVAKHMIEYKKGNIIFASSFATKLPSYSYGTYAASKSMLLSLVKSLAAELSPHNIRVNSYSPGVIVTEMTKINRQKSKQMMLKDIALNRFGHSFEIANGVLVLASDASSYIHGTDLDISGGKFIIQNTNVAYELLKDSYD